MISGHKLHALIIHKEPFFAPIKETLAGIGYASFDLVSSAAAARAAMRRRSPDLIVTAYRLPDGTASEAMNAICGAREYPVVFVTIETDAVLNWLPSAVIVTRPYEQLALEIAVEEAILKPYSSRRVRGRPLGGSTALLYS
jgi:DNA-binding response OmpR family regulator